MVIVSSVYKIGKSISLSKKQFEEILLSRIQYKPKIIQQDGNLCYYSTDKKINYDPNYQTSNNTQENLFKTIGYNILNDIDQISIEKVTNNPSISDDLWKDCLARNKCINGLIKKYQQKYKAYKNKPEHKKNRNPLDFCPTHDGQEGIVWKKQTYFWRMSPSPQRKFRVIKNRASLSVQPFQIQPCEPVDSSYAKQILIHAFASRQQCKQNKIALGRKNNLQVFSSEKPSSQLNQTTKNFSSISKQKTHRYRNNQSRSQRMKTINHRSYISSHVSIPLNEKN